MNTKCEFWFTLQLWSEKLPIRSRIHRDTIINVHSYSCNVSVILERSLTKLE
jgi:hypothetical protein